MPLDSSFIGRTYPPTPPYEVGRAKIAEFAAAIGDDHPAYRDPAAARELGYSDVIAPPTFSIVLTKTANDQVVHDPELGLDYSKVVHYEQRFVYTRPVRAGDLLTGELHVDDVRSAAGNDILTTRVEVSTVDGDHVVTAYGKLVARGTAEEPAG